MCLYIGVELGRSKVTPYMAWENKDNHKLHDKCLNVARDCVSGYWVAYWMHRLFTNILMKKRKQGWMRAVAVVEIWWKGWSLMVNWRWCKNWQGCPMFIYPLFSPMMYHTDNLKWFNFNFNNLYLSRTQIERVKCRMKCTSKFVNEM